MCGVGQGVRQRYVSPLRCLYPTSCLLAPFTPLYTLLLFAYSPPSWHPLQYKKTPLHFACANGRTEVAVKLVELGADVNAVNEVGPLGCV